MSEYTYKVSRDMRGALNAVTIVPFDVGERRALKVETSKGSRGVYCSANVVQFSEDGQSYSHIFGCATTGDYGKCLLYDKTLRATEKNIRGVHELALNQLDDVMAEAYAWYVRLDEAA